ncbi:hypothetical protein ACFE04_009645 [Oxalis oulophora]
MSRAYTKIQYAIQNQSVSSHLQNRTQDTELCINNCKIEPLSLSSDDSTGREGRCSGEATGREGTHSGEAKGRERLRSCSRWLFVPFENRERNEIEKGREGLSWRREWLLSLVVRGCG